MKEVVLRLDEKTAEALSGLLYSLGETVAAEAPILMPPPEIEERLGGLMGEIDQQLGKKSIAEMMQEAIDRRERAAIAKAEAEGSKGYSVRIWVEEVSQGAWDTWHCTSDVTVTFSDGQRWAATFNSYAAIATYVGSGKEAYYATPHAIIVNEVSRATVETVVAQLVETDQFAYVFKKVYPSDK